MNESLAKKTKKREREERVLLGLVELFIETGRPVGSQTLQECGFEDLSSATIRNYFARLEEEGFLAQQHASGGRIPTEKAFRLYAANAAENIHVHASSIQEVKEIASFLDRVAEKLSQETGCAAVISAPRFDHDFIKDVRLVSISQDRVLVVLITEFGLVKTEILLLAQDHIDLSHIENYFLWRLQNQDNLPPQLTHEEEEAAAALYHEIMVRYLVGYSHFTKLDLHKKGFSSLLAYPECSDPLTLAHILGLFEHEGALLTLIGESLKKASLTYFIGSDLNRFFPGSEMTSFVVMPYMLQQKTVGAIALLGPLRVDYQKLFTHISQAASEVGQTLTKSLYTFKLAFREPSLQGCYLTESENQLLIETQ